MTPAEYKAERQQRGTQQGVALALGVDYHTIQRRESGEIKITREADIALMSLRKKKRAPRRPNAIVSHTHPNHEHDEITRTF